MAAIRNKPFDLNTYLLLGYLAISGEKSYFIFLLGDPNVVQE